MKRILNYVVSIILIIVIAFSLGCSGDHNDDDLLPNDIIGGNNDNIDNQDDSDDTDDTNNGIDDDETDHDNTDDDADDDADDEDITLVGGSRENTIDTTPYLKTANFTATINSNDIYNTSDFINNYFIRFSLSEAPIITKGFSQTPYVGTDVQIANDGNNNFLILLKKKETSVSLQGELNGSLAFFTSNKFAVVLNGIEINSADRPAINVLSGKRAFIVSKDGTENSLTDSTNYDEDLGQKIYEQLDNYRSDFDSLPSVEDIDVKGAFFSEAQVIFSGGGTLNITAKNNHALVCDDYIRIVKGVYNITSVKDSIHANDYVIIDNGELNLTASSDGIDVEDGFIVINGGKITINAIGTSGKGITAGRESAYGTVVRTDNGVESFTVGQVYINNGVIDIVRSEESLEAKSEMFINDGFLNLRAYDDTISVITHLTINGGYIYCEADSDTIDIDDPSTDDKATINGGVIFVVGTWGSIDQAGAEGIFKITFNGGLIVALGPYAGRPSVTDSKQNSFVMSGASAGTAVSIKKQLENGDEETILSFITPKNFGTLLFSSPSLSTGDNYKVYHGGYSKSDDNFFGLHINGTYKRGEVIAEFVQTSVLTRISGIFWGGATS